MAIARRCATDLPQAPVTRVNLLGTRTPRRRSFHATPRSRGRTLTWWSDGRAGFDQSFEIA